MIHRRMPFFHNPDRNTRTVGSLFQHCPELRIRHEMTAGSRRKIASSWQQAHRGRIDLQVPVPCGGEGPAALGKCRRIKDDHVVGFRCFPQVFQQFKNIRTDKIHPTNQAVFLRIPLCLFQRKFRNIRSGHMFCAGFCGIHRKASRMCAAIQNRPSLRNRPDGPAVILLVEKESGLLSVFHVHFIADFIFRDFRQDR